MFKFGSRLGRAGILAGVVGFTGLCSAGCVENQPTIVVLRHVDNVPNVASGDAECDLSPDSTQPLRMQADVELQGPIVINLVVTNQQPDVSPDESNTLTNTSEVVLKRAEVKLDLPQIEEFEPIKFKEPLSKMPITGADEVLVPVTIPEDFVDQVGAFAPSDGELILNVEITVVAERTGNTVGNGLGEIDSRTYRVPIFLCAGCSTLCFETFDDMGEEVCFGRNNCVPPENIVTCGGIQNAQAAPACCSGETGVIGC